MDVTMFVTQPGNEYGDNFEWYRTEQKHKNIRVFGHLNKRNSE